MNEEGTAEGGEGGEGGKTDDDIIQEAKDKFEESQDVWAENHLRYEDDIRFGRLGKQWREEDEELRTKQSRPSLTINRMPAFIRQVVNDARQNKPSIKVHPNDDFADPEVAEVINGIIRNIEQTSKADLAYDTATDCAASGGFGYLRVTMDYADDDTFDMDIGIERIINPLTVFPDASDLEADSADWNNCIITEMKPRKEFEKEWPDAELIDWSSGSSDDQDQDWFEVDSIRIAEYWVREPVEKEVLLMASGDTILREVYEELEAEYIAIGNEIVNSRMVDSFEVTQYILNGQEVLETNAFPGKFIPIVPVYGEEVYIDGVRHFLSLIHFAKDPQRIYNYWRSASAELVALAPKAPYIGKTGSFNTDRESWETANTDNHAFLEFDGDIPPQRQPFAGPPAGALQEALNASDDMKTVIGINDNGLGQSSNEIAGVAIRQRRSEGDTSTFHFVDNMARAIRHTGNIIVGLIPHVYSRARMVRVLGEDGAPQTVAVNQPLTKQEQMLQGEAIERREAMNQVYDLTVGKYDVTVKSGPSFATQREEAREGMISVLQAFPQAAAITGDLVVEAMDWPNSDVFAKRLKSLLPPGLLDDDQDPALGQAKNQISQMEQVINQLMADREGKQEQNAVEHRKLDLEQQKIVIQGRLADTKDMEADIKAKSVEIDALLAANPVKDDSSAIVLKTMDIESSDRQAGLDAEMKIRDYDLEQQRIDLARAELALETYKAETSACISATAAQMGSQHAPPAQEPVQVFNVASASKTVDIKRDADNNIIGAEVVDT